MTDDTAARITALESLLQRQAVAAMTDRIFLHALISQSPDVPDLAAFRTAGTARPGLATWG